MLYYTSLICLLLLVCCQATVTLRNESAVIADLTSEVEELKAQLRVEKSRQLSMSGHHTPSHIVLGLLRLWGITPQSAVEKLIQHLAKSPSPAVLIDVGAHLGQEALLAVKSGVVVNSFEPDPRNCKKIEGTHASYLANGMMVLRCGAASSKSGQMKMSINDEHSDCVGCLAGNKNVHGVKEITVPVYAIDDIFFKEVSAQTYVIKTDTQGFELSVLEGANKLISKGLVPHIIVEFDPHLLDKQGPETAVQLLRFLDTHGYMCMDLSWLPEKGKTKDQTSLILNNRDFIAALRAHEGWAFTDLLCSYVK